MRPDKWQPFFENLERQGALAQLLDWLSEVDADAELEYRRLLRTVTVTNRQSLATLHQWQGRLSAFAHIRTLLRTLGQRQQLPSPAKIERRLTS